MNNSELKKIWQKKYDVVPQQLEKVRNTNIVATAFNTNIDAVLKIKGERLADLIKDCGLTEDEANNSSTNLQNGKDVVHGIFKCFTKGIAEEWITDDKSVYEWMSKNLGYDRLQMGGQGGIVANALSSLKVQKVIAHTNSHPKLQAEQFINSDNLLAIDENGKLKKAYEINRSKDIPLIHWIIEFDIDDTLEVWGKQFVCPKSNRFIATYDPANIDLVINEGFVKELNLNGFDYLILSGYHALTSKRNGVSLVQGTIPLIKEWKMNNPNGIIHLEVASTQDKEVRKSIVNDIAPLADSIGMNERETLDVLELIDNEKYLEIKDKKLTSAILFDALTIIKEYIKCPRIQLHMFGLYVTLQDKDFKITPEQNLNGMMLASVVAATKAGMGKIEDYDKLLWSYGREVADVSIKELTLLSEYIEDKDLIQKGISFYQNWDVIAVPTILIEKPLTLVGMGDTISSISLIGAR